LLPMQKMMRRGSFTRILILFPLRQTHTIYFCCSKMFTECTLSPGRYSYRTLLPTILCPTPIFLSGVVFYVNWSCVIILVIEGAMDFIKDLHERSLPRMLRILLDCLAHWLFRVLPCRSHDLLYGLPSKDIRLKQA